MVIAQVAPLAKMLRKELSAVQFPATPGSAIGTCKREATGRCHDETWSKKEGMATPPKFKGWNPKIGGTRPETNIDDWKISFLLGWLPGRCYVSFRLLSRYFSGMY